jgi:succinate-semialdehyde dehydrogenase / glutarate-semialdehyde dehydrogenase
MSYADVSLFIDGSWGKAAGPAIEVLNPATGDRIGAVEHATSADLDRALLAADRAFKTWSKVSAFDRYKIMRKSAEILRGRADAIARIMTLEQGRRPSAALTLSTGSPRKADALTGVSFPPARTACARW